MQRHPTLRSPSVPDRGPAQHFHGRGGILSDFGEVLDWAAQTKGGTTFLVQGAPGAGKTALLDQCEKLAKQAKWQAATINTAALQDPESLLDCLGKEGRLDFEKVSGQLGVNLGVKAGVTADFKRSGRTINTILRSQSKPLLLVLDEAQRLGQGDIVPAKYKGTVSDVMDYIHNGRAGTPVVLLAAGLGRTEQAFADLGVSRFRGGAFADLGSLSEESERAVIRDWLQKDGGANEAPHSMGRVHHAGNAWMASSYRIPRVPRGETTASQWWRSDGGRVADHTRVWTCKSQGLLRPQSAGLR